MDVIKNYVDIMFKEFPDTSENRQLQANVLDSMEGKYLDLLDSGKNEEEALGTVIAQFGDINELKEAYGVKTKATQNIGNNGRVKIEIDSDQPDGPEPCLRAESFPGPIIISGTDSWQGMMMPLAALIFLAIGFFTGTWHPTWLIFPILAIISSSSGNLKNMFIPISALVFLAIGFFTGTWHPTWLLIPGFALISDAHDYWIKKREKPLQKRLRKTIDNGSILAFLVLGVIFNAWHPAWAIFIFAWVLKEFVRRVIR